MLIESIELNNKSIELNNKVLIEKIENNTEKIDEIIQTLSISIRSKWASELSYLEYSTFGFVNIGEPDLSSIDMNITKALKVDLRVYAESIIDVASTDINSKEKDIIQPISRKFFESIRDKCKMSKYSLDIVHEIHFSTNLNCKGKLEEINGEADAILYYREIVLSSWEDKRLIINIDSPSCKAQIASQVKAFAEKFQSSLKHEPKTYWGVLSNGINILFVIRFVKNTGVSWGICGPFSLLTLNDEGKYIISESGLETLALCFSAMIRDICKLKDLTDKLIEELKRDDENNISTNSNDKNDENDDSDDDISKKDDEFDSYKKENDGESNVKSSKKNNNSNMSQNKR